MHEVKSIQNLLDFGPASTAAFLNVNSHELDGQDICQVTVEPSDSPIYVEQQGEETLYLRVGNRTQALPVKEAVTYVGRRWGNTA